MKELKDMKMLLLSTASKPRIGQSMLHVTTQQFPIHGIEIVVDGASYTFLIRIKPRTRFLAELTGSHHINQ